MLFYLTLTGLTLYFALTSPNLVVGDNWVTGAGTTLVTAGIIIVILIVLVGLYAYPQFYAFCHHIFVENGRFTASILLAVVVAWQLTVVMTLHPPIGWDAAALHQALTDTTSVNMRSYYSQNFNNVPIVLVMHAFAEFFGSTSWLTFDLITWVLVDISALFNLLTIWLVAPRRLTAGLYVHALWLVWFPTIIVPYTDAWVLPLVSLMILSYVCLTRATSRWGWWLPATLTLSASLIAAYFMKPSAIVPVLAMVAVSILQLLQHGWRQLPWRRVLVTFTLLLGMTAGSYYTVNQAVQNQTYITVDHGRAIPAIHFMNMGSYGDGGYKPHDALMMAVLPTKEARSEYAKRNLVAHLKKHGPIGYLGFLFQKHRNNTADGSFAWVKEGSFIDENPKPKPGPGLKNHLQQFLYLYGTRLGDFRWVAQVLWVACLVLMVFGWEVRPPFVQMLRIMVIGGFMYLLFFEGGRSRYLIQFLPAFLILASLLGEATVHRFRRLYTWGVQSNERKVEGVDY